MATPTTEMIRLVTERFAALADETRIRIMMHLRDGECNVSALCTALGVAQPSVSKHLGVLRRAGLVDIRREGSQHVCFVSDQSIFDMCDIVCSGVVRHHSAIGEALGINQGNRDQRSV